MSRKADFSNDLDAISATVERDVGAFMKLVREGTEPLQKEPTLDRDANWTKSQQIGELDAKNPLPATTKRPGRQRSKARPKPNVPESVALVNVTTRIRRETNELLTEAALRQRLAKKTPDTRQDIIEAALQEWFTARRF